MKVRWLLLGLLVLVVACFWCLHCGPSRVWVKFSNLPRGTCFTSVVVERNGALHNLNWYYMTELLVPMTSHPGQDVGSELPGAQISASDLETLGLRLLGGPDPDYPVEWISGDRYGVVNKTKAGVWSITWYSPEQVAPHRDIRHFGGKAVALDLT